MSSHRYYSPSGRFSVVTTAIAFVVGVIGSAILACLYAVLDFYNPFIYLNALACIGVGVAGGALAVWTVHLGKVRSTLIKTLMVFVLSATTIYVTWLAYLYSLIGWGKAGGTLFTPWVLFEIIAALGKEGLWQIKDLKPTGWALYSVWLVEAGTIFGCIAMATFATNDPFCEDCENWMEAAPGILLFPPLENPDELKLDLENEHYESLLKLPTYEEGANYCQLDLHLCHRCLQAPQYLTLNACETGVDDEGNPYTNTNAVVQHLIISSDFVDTLRKDADRRAQEYADKQAALDKANEQHDPKSEDPQGEVYNLDEAE